MYYRILHVLSANFYAGSVSYAINVAEKQSELGNQLYIVSDRENLSQTIPCTQLPISVRTIPQRIKNIIFLIKFIKEHNIQIIHSHSRAASWVSFYAAKFCNVPLVSTIHGMQAKRSDFYGEEIICICDNLVIIMFQC